MGRILRKTLNRKLKKFSVLKFKSFMKFDLSTTWNLIDWCVSFLLWFSDEEDANGNVCLSLVDLKAYVSIKFICVILEISNNNSVLKRNTPFYHNYHSDHKYKPYCNHRYTTENRYFFFIYIYIYIYIQMLVLWKFLKYSNPKFNGF